MTAEPTCTLTDVDVARLRFDVRDVALVIETLRARVVGRSRGPWRVDVVRGGEETRDSGAAGGEKMSTAKVARGSCS